MVTGVGLLCSRVRVEEKGIMGSLSNVGIPSCVVSPDHPFPAAALPGTGTMPRVTVDRCADRTVASVLLPILRTTSTDVLDAGLAATGNRVTISLALQASRISRPEMHVAIGEEQALAVVEAASGLTTLLPLAPGATGVVLWDLDTAEAVLEHRSVLGGASEKIFVLQSGAPAPEDRATLIVVDGSVVGIDTVGDVDRASCASSIATRAAAVLGAFVVGVEVAWSGSQWAVWDVHPVPDFRAATATGKVPVADAIAQSISGRISDDVRTIIPIDLSALQRLTTGGMVDGVAAGI